jgi:F-type H+-transporting ATPase subunit b
MKKRLRDLLTWLLGNPSTRRAFARTAMVCTVMLFASAALAAGGGHGGHGDPHINWWTWSQEAPPVGWFILDFIAFVGLLVFLLKKPVAAMFQKRHETIKASIDEATSTHAKAQAHYTEYHSKIARLDDEVGKLIAGAKDDGKSERENIIAAAKEYARGLREASELAAGQEAKDTEMRLRQQFVGAVMVKAEELIHTEMKKDDQVRLLEQAIKELESAPLTTRNAGAMSPEAVA